MDATHILHRLGTDKGLPVDALRAASADRAAVAPAFVHAIEQHLAGRATPETKKALFFVVHLLGEWREKSAYRPLAALLRQPPDEVDKVLGGAITETTHRVMAAVFDGDPAPLYDVIRDPEADEFVRSRMCEALAMVTLRGELPREEAARFLRACHAELEPQDECFVWQGWQSAIALLGLVELVPLVKQAFERELISRTWLSFQHFEKYLQQTVSGARPPLEREGQNFTLFGDTVQELSTWYAFSPERDKEKKRAAARSDSRVWYPSLSRGPAVNPFKDVGRNDPCPCGSGRKFKKCCLGKAAAPPPATEPVRAAEPVADLDWIDDALNDDELAGERIEEYDPHVEPDPEAWLALDEQERIVLVEAYHRDEAIKLPNLKVHAIMHVVVENQIAEGDALPARRTAERLMAEGLDRHDAIHAIGSVLILHLRDMISGARSGANPNKPYLAELERLTADSWQRPES
jgi:hypothetical protein